MGKVVGVGEGGGRGVKAWDNGFAGGARVGLGIMGKVPQDEDALAFGLGEL